MKPLFIPLKREYFEQFAAGTKTEEFRPNGPRWNAQTCAIGRRVTLSLGYGKAHRLTGTVTSFRLDPHISETSEAWRACYGSRSTVAACIGISLNEKTAP